jgi:uncharacterized RDD family membrane protein YckC
MREAPLDNTIEIVTPENIAFHYRLAGPFRRLSAYAIDLFVRLLLMAAAIMLLTPLASQLRQVAAGIFSILWFALEWLYGGVFETYMNGQTPGKRLLGLRVLTLEGQPVNGLQAVLRNILRSADTMPWTWIGIDGSYLPVPVFAVGLLTMALNSRFQRLGDIVCGTMVVSEERQWFAGMTKTEDPRVVKLAAELPADMIITRTMARVVATYVERRRFFSGPRRREIARHLGDPLVARLGLPPDTIHDHLLCALYYRAFISERVTSERLPDQESHPTAAGAISE